MRMDLSAWCEDTFGLPMEIEMEKNECISQVPNPVDKLLLCDTSEIP